MVVTYVEEDYREILLNMGGFHKDRRKKEGNGCRFMRKGASPLRSQTYKDEYGSPSSG